MRVLTLPLVLLCVGCPSERRCDAAACEVVCEESALGSPGSDELSAYEAGVIGLEALQDLRLGLRIDDPGLEVCRGTESCEEPVKIGPENKQPLPRGAYIVRGKLRVPAHGTWAVEVTTVCVDRAQDVIYEHRDRLAVLSGDGGRMIEPLAAVDLHLKGRDEAQCQVHVGPADGKPGTAAAIVFSLSGRID